MYNTFRDKRHLLILVAITQVSKALQVFNFTRSSIQDGGQNSKKSEHFRGPSGVVLSTLGIQNLSEISLSLLFSE